MVAAVHAGRLAAFGTKEEVLGNRDGKVVAPTTVAGNDQINIGPLEAAAAPAATSGPISAAAVREIQAAANTALGQ